MSLVLYMNVFVYMFIFLFNLPEYACMRMCICKCILEETASRHVLAGMKSHAGDITLWTYQEICAPSFQNSTSFPPYFKTTKNPTTVVYLNV